MRFSTERLMKHDRIVFQGEKLTVIIGLGTFKCLDIICANQEKLVFINSIKFKTVKLIGLDFTNPFLSLSINQLRKYM